MIIKKNQIILINVNSYKTYKKIINLLFNKKILNKIFKINKINITNLVFQKAKEMKKYFKFNNKIKKIVFNKILTNTIK